MDDEQKKKPLNKARLIAIAGMVVDGALIGLLIFAIISHSCEICFSTNVGATTYTKCKSYSQILEDGLPSEVIDLYTAKEQEFKETENLTLQESVVMVHGNR